MKTARVKKFPWGSLTLLLVAYASFGWFLSGTVLYEEMDWLKQTIPLPDFIDPVMSRSHFPTVLLLLAVGWIWLLTTALMNPLTNFSRFITRWFKSDTIAFLTICMVAGMAAVFLFWLHLFLYIVTIVATEMLARIDTQTAGFSESKAFWLLSLFSLMGLGSGWIARDVIPKLVPWLAQGEQPACLIFALQATANLWFR